MDNLNGYQELQVNDIEGVFSDFDGTLSSIQNSPDTVQMNARSKQALERLKSRFTVGIISGRPLNNLVKMVGVKNIYYIGNHGAEIYKDSLFVFPNAKKAAPLLKKIHKDLTNNLSDPFLIEMKKYSASVHYRKHPEPEKAREEIYKIIEPYKDSPLIYFNDGRKVVEIRIKGINKAVALKWILQKEGINNFIFFGDDVTDIDIFKLRLPNQTNFLIANRETDKKLFDYADYMLNNTDDVAEVLEAIALLVGS